MELRNPNGSLSQPAPADLMLTVNWQSEVERLLRDITGESGRLSKTIVKYPNFSIVLMVMKSNTKFPEHKSTGRISVHVLKGHIQMRILDKLVDLPAGNLIALDREVLHDVEALDESAFILTICCSEAGEKP